jgi:hypothetical protein
MSTASEHYGQLAGEAGTASEDRRRWVLEEIQRDARRDVERFEGQPMTGKTVAEYMGCQAAAIAALARVVATLLPTEAAAAKNEPSPAAEMVPPAMPVYTGIVSPDCFCEWRSGVEALELNRVDPVCPLHGRGAPFDAMTPPYVNPGDDTVNGSWST